MSKQKHCDCETFKAERDKAIQRARDLQEGDEWNWMGTDEDDLESMSEGMVVRIRAGDLRELLDKERDEYERKRTLGDRLFSKKMCTYSGMKSFPVFDIPEKPEQALTVGIGPGFEPATVTLKHIGSQFKISKEELDKAQEEMPSMVEKVQRLAMGGGALGSIDHQTCMCDQMDGGKLCESWLTMAHGPICPPLPHHALCTCDSDCTDGVCQIHKRKGDGTDGK